MTDESLPGGFTTGAVLIGDVIHKPAAPWTSTVHALLRHLVDVGFDDAPRALGIDAAFTPCVTPGFVSISGGGCPRQG